MLKDTLREIMIFNEGSWGHPRASPKSENSGKGEMAKFLFFKGKSRNGMRNDMAFVQVIQSLA